jgi:hypothetical protein
MVVNFITMRVGQFVSNAKKIKMEDFNHTINNNNQNINNHRSIIHSKKEIISVVNVVFSIFHTGISK